MADNNDTKIKELEDRISKLEKGNKGGKVKKVKDPNAPKKPPTAFQTHMKDTLARIKADEGEKYNHKAAFSKAVEEWNANKADKAEKADK